MVELETQTVPPVLVQVEQAYHQYVEPILTPRAQQYLAQFGRCWQGLPTSAAPPPNLTPTRPTVGTNAPADQSEKDGGVPWPSEIRQIPLPMSLRVDCYAGPDGVGYVVVIQADVGPAAEGREIWEWTINVGPEIWRAHSWQPVSALAGG